MQDFLFFAVGPLAVIGAVLLVFERWSAARQKRRLDADGTLEGDHKKDTRNTTTNLAVVHSRSNQIRNSSRFGS